VPPAFLTLFIMFDAAVSFIRIPARPILRRSG
jgi:hypothetical protein